MSDLRGVMSGICGVSFRMQSHGGRHALMFGHFLLRCESSSLSLSLTKVESLTKGKLPARKAKGKDFTPHFPEDGAAFAPFVEIFREGTLQG